jgi:hypothetical protein
VKDLILPSEYQVAKEIDDQYNELRKNFRSKHKPFAIRAGFASTFDFSQAGPDFGVLTFHYIDDSWSLRAFVLDFMPYPMDQSKEMDNVAEFVCDLLTSNGIDENEARKAPIVTDEASNMNAIGNDLGFNTEFILFRTTLIMCLPSFKYNCKSRYRPVRQFTINWPSKERLQRRSNSVKGFAKDGCQAAWLRQCPRVIGNLFVRAGSYSLDVGSSHG